MIRIERTGKVYSFSSTEYWVTYPDGYVGTIWSPPWHDLDDADEDAAALEFAESQYAAGTHKDIPPKVKLR